jgi:hypothetical protein
VLPAEEHPTEDALTLHFSPRKVPLLLLPYFYQHVFHFVMPFIVYVCICIFSLIGLKMLNGVDGGIAAEFRWQQRTLVLPPDIKWGGVFMYAVLAAMLSLIIYISVEMIMR